MTFTREKMRTWLGRPFVQRLILLVLAALLALCVGCGLLLSQQPVLASTLAMSQARGSRQTCNMLSPYTENVTGPNRGRYLAAYTDMVFGQTAALQGIIGFSATDEAQATLP